MEHIKDILPTVLGSIKEKPVAIYAFSFKHSKGKVPEGVPILDCRTMKNCFSIPAARKAPQFNGLVAKGLNAAWEKKHLACGCDYGKHRSVAVAEEISKQLGVPLIKL